MGLLSVCTCICMRTHAGGDGWASGGGRTASVRKAGWGLGRMWGWMGLWW